MVKINKAICDVNHKPKLVRIKKLSSNDDFQNRPSVEKTPKISNMVSISISLTAYQEFYRQEPPHK